MAKFKKLALLCTALLASASLAVSTGCDLSNLFGGGSSSESEVESVEESSTPDDDESSSVKEDDESSVADSESEVESDDESNEESDSEADSESDDSTSEGEEAPLPDTDISIADAVEIGAAMEHDTYTEGKYYIAGIIKEVKNATFGNVVIEDEDGNSILVYGTYSEDGSTRYDALEVKPGVGDYIKVYGILGQYNDTPQMKDGWIVDFDNLVEDVVVEEPEADSVLSIAEAVALGDALKADSQNKYYISGTVESIANDYHGNMTINDGNGNSIYIYGTYSADGSTKYGAMDNAPQVGDTITVYSIVSYYNSVQLKNAWIVESTSYPDAPAVDYYELIVDGADASISADALGAVWADLTLTIDEAGVYGIYATDEEFNAVDVKFGESYVTDGQECATNFTFEVWYPGEISLKMYQFFWDAGTTNFKYYVYKINTFEITETEGSAELLASLRVPVKFVAPAAGTFVLTTTKEIGWFDSLSVSDDGTLSYSKEFMAFAADEEFNFYVKYEDLNYESFDFEWTVTEKEIPAVVLGANELTFAAYEQKTVRFTAETAGAYEMSLDSAYGLFITNANYESTFAFALAEGESIDLTIYFNGQDANYENNFDTLTTNVTITTIETDDPSNLQEGTNTFVASPNGTAASFTAPEAGWYRFEDNYAYSMWFEDTVADDWGDGESTKELQLAAGETVNFSVKYDGMVTLTISTFVPPVSLTLGENTVNVPGAGTDLEFDLEYNKAYSLTCNNENVVVYVNGMPYVPGAELLVFGWSSFSIGTLDGADVESVVITVAEFVYPTLNDGDNEATANVSGVTYQYTATDAGCYAFTVTGDVTYVTANSDDAYNYPDSLEGAGTISINVKPGAVITLVLEAAAETAVTVNVACTSTVNALEASVAMDDTGAAPASLTIASLPSKGAVYFVASRMVGDYVLTWNGAEGVVVYAGENVGLPYDPQVRLTRTMMDGFVYLVVINNSDSDYENFVLNFAAYEEPAAEPQGQLVEANVETTIEIAAWGDAIISFVAPAAGTYTLTTASSVLVDLWQYNENWQAYDRAWVNVIDSEVGGEYSFNLAEGEIIDFFVMEYDMGAVSFVFTISDNTAGGEAPHVCNLVHMEAVEPGCHYDGNIEYWVCYDCETVWQDEACTQLTNIKNVVLPATGGNVVHFEAIEPACHYAGNIEYWVCYDCEQVWQDEALTQLTNIKNVVLPAVGGDVIHVEAVEAADCQTMGNIEYWYCEGCMQVWTDEALTQLTNMMNVKLGYGEHSYFYACDPVCQVCYEITNPNATHTVVHKEAVTPTCTAMGNIEYWYCSDCGTAWTDEAQTMLTNMMSVNLPMADHTGYEEDYVCDVCSGVVAPAAGSTLTFAQAIALGLAGGTDAYTTDKYYVIGYITRVYDTKYGNMYIVDESGAEFTIYGTYSADGADRYDAISDKPVAGDYVTFYGIIGNFKGGAQMKNGWMTEVVKHTECTWVEATCLEAKHCKYCGVTEGDLADHTYVEGECSVCGKVEGSAALASAKLDFSDKANRTSFSSSQQVWEQNGVKLTNNKGSSTSNVADYADPARFYKSSQVIIEGAGMTKIEFTCSGSSYATALKNSISDANATVTVSGSVVTVVFTTAVDQFTFVATGGQVRVSSLVVNG